MTRSWQQPVPLSGAVSYDTTWKVTEEHAAGDESGTEIDSNQDEANWSFSLGHHVVRLVFSPIFPSPDSSNIWTVAPLMALVMVILTILVLCIFCMSFASLGNRVLRALRVEMRSDGVHILVAIAVGLIITEISLFLIQITQHIRQGSFVIAALSCGLMIWESKSVWE
jgi:hypothetical protein